MTRIERIFADQRKTWQNDSTAESLKSVQPSASRLSQDGLNPSGHFE
jgi:hypothetical protein